MSILKKLTFSFYDYHAQPLVAKTIKTVVLHIPDQIGDAMATYPLIRSLEKQQITHLIIIASTLKHHEFAALTLANTRLTVILQPK